MSEQTEEDQAKSLLVAIEQEKKNGYIEGLKALGVEFGYSVSPQLVINAKGVFPELLIIKNE